MHFGHLVFGGVDTFRTVLQYLMCSPACDAARHQEKNVRFLRLCNHSLLYCTTTWQFSCHPNSEPYNGIRQMFYLTQFEKTQGSCYYDISLCDTHVRAVSFKGRPKLQYSSTKMEMVHWDRKAIQRCNSGKKRLLANVLRSS